MEMPTLHLVHSFTLLLNVPHDAMSVSVEFWLIKRIKRTEDLYCVSGPESKQLREFDYHHVTLSCVQRRLRAITTEEERRWAARQQRELRQRSRHSTEQRPGQL